MRRHGKIMTGDVSESGAALLRARAREGLCGRGECQQRTMSLSLVYSVWEELTLPLYLRATPSVLRTEDWALAMLSETAWMRYHATWK